MLLNIIKSTNSIIEEEKYPSFIGGIRKKYHKKENNNIEKSSKCVRTHKKHPYLNRMRIVSIITFISKKKMLNNTPRKSEL